MATADQRREIAGVRQDVEGLQARFEQARQDMKVLYSDKLRLHEQRKTAAGETAVDRRLRRREVLARLAEALLRHYELGTAKRGRPSRDVVCDVLLTNQVVSRLAAARVAERAAECPRASLGVLVDSARGVEARSLAFAPPAAGVPLADAHAHCPRCRRSATPPRTQTSAAAARLS